MYSAPYFSTDEPELKGCVSIHKSNPSKDSSLLGIFTHFMALLFYQHGDQ